ncbi:MAG: carboxypeptidase-like regulatory domain-containing protein [Flavobacteriaceae bacterium]|nr:carboxypeptidase-like regulatory domain-containing protein [Flavobacteriaceae bacterium]
MKKFLFVSLLFFYVGTNFAQTKVRGYVFDEDGKPLAYANILFKGSIEGTTSDENGLFYLESKKTWKKLVVSFIGFQSIEMDLLKRTNYNLKFTLKEDSNTLNEIVIVTGKLSKKNNPAIDILRKIWERKRKNGVKQFKQYQYNKYQKVEFDLNTIDSAFKKKRLFRGMEFAFKNIDTSEITGKTYLPVFLNESVTQVYGDNILKKEKQVLKGNKNSGFSNNQAIIDFIDDLYSDYDIYDNYIKFFYKSFVSPLSKTGIANYNYYLADSSFIDNKWCYNIIYYPRRKNELTFKGDFWVNDTTFAIKEINMQASKNANINWVKDIYIEQEFDILNDSVFLLKRDYFLSDFALNKREKSKGLYGKRTTLFNNYEFNKPLDPKFYDKRQYDFDNSINNQPDEFWEANRLEKLNKDEQGVYKLLDTLKTVPKFKRIYSLIATFSSGYYEFDNLNFDYGPIFSTFGFNDVEGLRVRTGGRTYFGYNDPWRVQAYTAYGFKDKKFKYGFQGKVILDKKSRLIISGGNRRDVEQIGASLTASTDVLGRSNGSSSIVGTGSNDRLTNINLSMVSVLAEPFRNLEVSLSGTYKTLRSASPTFSLDYNDPSSPTGISSKIKQFETIFSASYYPGRKVSGTGVERITNTDKLRSVFLQITKGSKGILNGDFDYTKVQFSYTQPWFIGGFGRLRTSFEAGKTFGEVPLGLLSIVPGNQTFFAFFNTFNQLDFYEFVTDTYASFHLEHNFNGRLFARIPLFRRLNLRTIVGFRAAWGQLSDKNRLLNTTNNPSQIMLQAPDGKPYYEYSIGIGNILKVLRVDFNFRGNYLDNPGARKFGITFGTGFNF